MTERARLVALAEGMPPDTPPADVIDAALLKRDRRRDELQSLALAVCSAVGVCLSGGDTSQVVRPFYTAREWDAMVEEAETQRQMAAQMAQIAKLRRLGARQARTS